MNAHAERFAIDCCLWSGEVFPEFGRTDECLGPNSGASTLPPDEPRERRSAHHHRRILASSPAPTGKPIDPQSGRTAMTLYGSGGRVAVGEKSGARKQVGPETCRLTRTGDYRYTNLHCCPGRTVGQAQSANFRLRGHRADIPLWREGRKVAEIPAFSKLARSIFEDPDQAGLNAATRDTPFSERLIGRAVHGRDIQWRVSTWAARPNGG
jgi:hypothetical protein